jgi:small subunit ribosomal protein S6
VLLDGDVEDDQRTRILADIETMIADAGGTIVSAHDWGRRKMEFEIRHKPEAEYHLIQFQGSRELLERLERTLRITDAVLRHRVIKLKPGTPEPPDLRRAAPAGTTVAEPDAA